MSNGVIRDIHMKQDVGVTREQIPGTVAFAITDFKVQGHSMKEYSIFKRLKIITTSGRY